MENKNLHKKSGLNLNAKKNKKNHSLSPNRQLIEKKSKYKNGRRFETNEKFVITIEKKKHEHSFEKRTWKCFWSIFCHHIWWCHWFENEIVRDFFSDFCDFGWWVSNFQWYYDFTVSILLCCNLFHNDDVILVKEMGAQSSQLHA